jgi:hypothetical protein
MRDADTPTTPTTREGTLVEFLRRNLFRVKLSNGVAIVAVMPDELLPSFDPNVQLTKYNYPLVDIEMREPPQMPKIVAIKGSGGWCGPIPRKFWEYEE